MNRLNQPKDHSHKHPTHCPYCGEQHDAATSLSHPGEKPRAEDISLCANCGEFGQFNDKLQLVKISDELKADIMKDKRAVLARMAIKGTMTSEDPVKKQQLEAQCQGMLEGAIAWIAEHKDKTISIQYNFPSGVGVIATIGDALQKHFISVNDDAMQMFKELGWLDDVPTMPTVFMLKVVMDHVTKPV